MRCAVTVVLSVFAISDAESEACCSGRLSDEVKEQRMRRDEEVKIRQRTRLAALQRL